MTQKNTEDDSKREKNKCAKCCFEEDEAVFSQNILALRSSGRRKLTELLADHDDRAKTLCENEPQIFPQRHSYKVTGSVATSMTDTQQHRTPSLPQLVTISDSSVQETSPKALLLPLQSILSCCLCASDAQNYSTAKVEQKEKRNQTSQLVSLLRNAPRLEEEERRGPFPALVRLCFHFL